MSVATLSPVKILSDLGYEIWDMESDADMRSALIEAINTLTFSNPSDGRIPVLQEAVKNIQRPKFKRKTVGVNKLLNRKAPSNQKVSPQKLLPAASEEGGEKDQTIITSNLAERLGNIQDVLQSLSVGFRRQLGLDKRVAEVDARNAKEQDKLDKENKLEKKKTAKFSGLGFKKLTKPAVGFFDTLINFFKNIFIGSALLGMINWVNDPENKKRVDEFGKFFTEKAPWILGGIAALTAINIISPLLGFANAVIWVGGGILGFLGKRMFPGTFGSKTTPKSGGVKSKGFKSPIKRQVKVTQGSNWFKRGLDRINPFKGQGVTKGSNWFSRAKSKLFGGGSVTGSGIKPPVRSIPQAPKIGFLKKIPFQRVAGILRVIGLGFLIAELKADWERGDTRAVVAKLIAYGAGWLVTTLGLAVGTKLGVTGIGTVPGIAMILGSGAAGAATDHYVRKMLLGNSSQPAVVQQNQNVVQSRKVTPPNLTSNTGTGKLSLLNLGGGGATPSVTGGGESGGEDETLPFFNSSDPNNMSTLAVRSVYGLVN